MKDDSSRDILGLSWDRNGHIERFLDDVATRLLFALSIPHIFGDFTNVPYQPQLLQQLQAVVGDIDFPPIESLPGGGRVVVVIVCQPSPMVTSARMKLLRLSSPVS